MVGLSLFRFVSCFDGRVSVHIKEFESRPEQLVAGMVERRTILNGRSLRRPVEEAPYCNIVVSSRR